MREKVGYSLGDVAANLVFQMMMIFQLKFYTDVFGLDGAVAGSVLLVVCLSAVVVDPAVGLLADRTNTRWGKFRPWLIWTALPFAVFYVLAFYNPGIHQKGMVAAYATISYLLFWVLRARSWFLAMLIEMRSNSPMNFAQQSSLPQTPMPETILALSRVPTCLRSIRQ